MDEPMKNKVTVTVTDNETGKVMTQTGSYFAGVVYNPLDEDGEPHDGGAGAMQVGQATKMEKLKIITHLDSLCDQILPMPEQLFLAMMAAAGGEEDDCDCPACKARRAAEGAMPLVDATGEGPQ